MFVRASRWWKMFPASLPRSLSAIPRRKHCMRIYKRAENAVVGCGCGKAVLGRLHKCHKTAFVPCERYTSSITLSLIINQNHCIVLVVASLEAWLPTIMSTTMTVTKPTAVSARAGVMDHSIYPPIERFQTIDGVVRSHAAEQEQKPAICYPVSAAADYEEHTPAEVDRYVDITAQYYINQGLPPAVSAGTFLSSADCSIANILPIGSLSGASTSRCTTGRLKFRNYSYVSRFKSTWLCYAFPVYTPHCLCICQADGHGQLPQIDHSRKLPTSRHRHRIRTSGLLEHSHPATG